MKFNKLTVLLLTGVMCFTLAGSIVNAASSSSDVSSSETETSDAFTVVSDNLTEDQMVEETGIDLPAPDGAEDVTYAVVDLDGTTIAQMTYTIDGHKLTERACATDLTSLFYDDTDVNSTESDIVSNVDELPEFVTDMLSANADISTFDYVWTSYSRQIVTDRDAYVEGSDEGPCYIAWLDTVPGILYNLYSTDELDEEQLVEYAEQVFVPVQGES